MESDVIELCRYRDAENVAGVKNLLEEKEIPFRVGSTVSNFDITTIGSGSEAEMVFSVRRSDYSRARNAMEEYFLKFELPDDHFLQTASDDDLAEVLGKEDEWSPFDVAHARILAKERGVKVQDVAKQKDEMLSDLRRGKPAPKYLILLGWLFATLGGLFGIGIAWSICYCKEKSPKGEFFTYDEKSRREAKPMLIWAVAVFVFYLLVRVLLV